MAVRAPRQTSARPKLPGPPARPEHVTADPNIGLEVPELDDRLVAGLDVLRRQLHGLIAIVVRIDFLDILGAQLFEQLAAKVVDLGTQRDEALLVDPADSLGVASV